LQDIVLRELADGVPPGVHLERVNMIVGYFLDDAAPILRLDHWKIGFREGLARLAWVAASVAALFPAARFLDRAAARAPQAAIAFDRENGASLAWLTALLTPLQRSPWGILFTSELLIILRTRPAWWWLALLVTWAMQLFATLTPNPPLYSVAMAVVFAWALLLDIFSRTVLRDIETNTQGLIFTSVSADNRIVITRWVVLVALAWLCTLPAMLRCAVQAPPVALNVLLLGVSIPTLAMAVGALVRAPRLFELFFCTMAYLTYSGFDMLNVILIDGRLRLIHLMMAGLGWLLLKLMWDRLRTRQ
jgi:hypothetical protein